MSDDMISKPRARSVRLVSQVAAVVCIALAVLIVLVGVPFLDKPAASPIAFTTVETESQEIYRGIVARRTETETVEEDAPVDLGAIQFALEGIGNAPVIKVDEEAPDPGDGGVTGPVIENSKTRFLGTIGVGDRLLALVSAGGSQRIMAEGAEATLAVGPGDDSSPPTVRIRGISSDRLLIVENGIEHMIERAPRVGVAVSMSSASLPARGSDSPVSPRSASTPGSFNDADQVKAVNPDDYRREDGTIDYEALRAAARERARQRQDLRRQQREENGEGD